MNAKLNRTPHDRAAKAKGKIVRIVGPCSVILQGPEKTTSWLRYALQRSFRREVPSDYVSAHRRRAQRALFFRGGGFQLRIREQVVKVVRAMARSRDEIDELIASREQAGKMLDEGASWLRRLQLRKKNGAE
ncbi:MAG: hypothetical protein OXC26_25430, partial [Albidovulum sp.]|nr:hypothetical protein [Albidovulum sp.]